MNPILASSIVLSAALVATKAISLAPAPSASGLDPEVLLDTTVEPGLVPWHANLDEAKAAAAVSGKPVLVFQLLGRLDERFC